MTCPGRVLDDGASTEGARATYGDEYSLKGFTLGACGGCMPCAQSIAGISGSATGNVHGRTSLRLGLGLSITYWQYRYEPVLVNGIMTNIRRLSSRTWYRHGSFKFRLRGAYKGAAQAVRDIVPSGVKAPLARFSACSAGCAVCGKKCRGTWLAKQITA